jgi:hypothetical protein
MRIYSSLGLVCQRDKCPRTFSSHPVANSYKPLYHEKFVAEDKLDTQLKRSYIDLITIIAIVVGGM